MDRFTVRELECFVAVAENHSFSEAARQLHLSQPPITRHIQSLEEKLGAKLFDRNTHGVSLTNTGSIFLQDARAILSQMDRANETVRRVCKGETRRLRLAFIGALLDENLVSLLQRFRSSHLNHQIHITDLAPAAQLSALRAGELDGGFIGAKPSLKAKDLEFVVWASEPLMLALPETHELARLRALTWKNLKGLNWVMVSRQAAPPFRQQFSKLNRTHHLSARIIQESERAPAILTMVAAGSGITMVPKSLGRLIPKGVVFRKLPTPEPLIEHTFAYPLQNTSPALSEFLKLLDGDSRG